MSLHVEVRINAECIGGLVITRHHGNSTDHDSVNEYHWRYMSHGRQLGSGTVMHRYGDGALALVQAALAECSHLTAAPKVAR